MGGLQWVGQVSNLLEKCFVVDLLTICLKQCLLIRNNALMLRAINDLLETMLPHQTSTSFSGCCIQLST
jgi:hypothetical protein